MPCVRNGNDGDQAADAKAVLDVLGELLAEGRDDEIVELVTELLTRNTQLEVQLAARLLRRQGFETVSSNQLLLMLGELADQAANDDGSRGLGAAAGLSRRGRAPAVGAFSFTTGHAPFGACPVKSS